MFDRLIGGTLLAWVVVVVVIMPATGGIRLGDPMYWIMALLNLFVVGDYFYTVRSIRYVLDADRFVVRVGRRVVFAAPLRQLLAAEPVRSGYRRRYRDLGVVRPRRYPPFATTRGFLVVAREGSRPGAVVIQASAGLAADLVAAAPRRSA